MSNSAESFNQQHESEVEKDIFIREQFEVAGGVADVVDIKPEKIKTDVPVLFAPAWGCTIEVYKPTLKELSEHERRVISLDHPRVGGDFDAAKEAEGIDDYIDKYPQEELRKALNILNVLDQKCIEKVDVITHSEAAINTAIAALLHPEKFRNIVFFAPAGMIGEDKFTRLLQGFAAQSKPAESTKDLPMNEAQKHVASVVTPEVLKYLAKNPIRALNETRDIAKTQIHEIIRYLHDKGIGIVVMAAVDDPVFPMNDMQKIAKMDMLDGFLSVKGGHGGIGERPEMFMNAAEQMLTALEKTQQKNEAGVRDPSSFMNAAESAYGEPKKKE